MTKAIPTSRGRVLLTGASGFIMPRGNQAVASGRIQEIHAAALSALELPSDVLWHHADFLDHADMTRVVETVRPSHLLHFAQVYAARKILDRAAKSRLVARERSFDEGLPR